MRRCRPFGEKNNILSKRILLLSIYRRPITHDTNDPRLAGDTLRSPGKVARVETEGAVLGVTTTGAHGVDTLRTELGVCGLATELELPLLAVVGALGTGRRTLVS